MGLQRSRGAEFLRGFETVYGRFNDCISNLTMFLMQKNNSCQLLGRLLVWFNNVQGRTLLYENINGIAFMQQGILVTWIMLQFESLPDVFVQKLRSGQNSDLFVLVVEEIRISRKVLPNLLEWISGFLRNWNLLWLWQTLIGLLRIRQGRSLFGEQFLNRLLLLHSCLILV